MRCIPTVAAGITLGVDTHKDFHVALDGLVAEAAPQLVAMEGVGTDTATSLLIAAGAHQKIQK